MQTTRTFRARMSRAREQKDRHARVRGLQGRAPLYREMDTRQILGNSVAEFQYVDGRGILPNALVEPSETSSPQTLRINVVYTDPSGTRIALKRAVELAIDLEAEPQIIVPHVVPYPLPRVSCGPIGIHVQTT